MILEPPGLGQRQALTSIDRIDAYLRVLHALMLRDMRTRFLGSYWGYVIAVIWPVVHMFIIAGIMYIRGASAPIGENALIFAATGAIPLLAYQYVAREMMKGALYNKPLTYYPQVRMLDVMFSRVIVEIISSFLGVAIIFALIFSFGMNPLPVDYGMAISGYICAIVFGIAIGTVNVAIVQFFQGWLMGFVLFTIVVYGASGVIFLPNDLPEKAYAILKWNPVVSIIEWVRLGYEPGLNVQIDYAYLFLWITISFSLGLWLEKTFGRSAAG